MMKETELVMGISRGSLIEHGVSYFCGFSQKEWIAQIMKAITLEASFRHRGNCENDPGFKQVIPYCILTQGDSVFVYRRKAAGAETRLHDKYSIGIGGHINPEAGTFSILDTINRSILRELAEEVVISSPASTPKVSLTLIGALNWDKDDVGKVHLGLVYHVRLEPSVEVRVRETDQLEGGFHPFLRLTEIKNWETWSQLIVASPFFKEGGKGTISCL
jgi:predicted NUDIX family phosphoesterase